MSLQFYIGNSGSGKSYTLYQQVLKAAGQNSRHQYIVLVPEQFTMQTQKSFVSMSPSHGILNIDILSFERLAYRVFSETNTAQLPILDEIGKIFVVRKAAEEKKQDLIVMGNYLSKIGYINEVKSMISEFMQYDVQGEVLDKLLQENQNQQQIFGKLHDMKLIYETFQDFLKEQYITSEELLDALYRVADQSLFLKDATIILDGFTGFTPVQKKLIGRLLGLCQDMWVTVTYDTSQPVRSSLPDYHLFYMSAKMMKDLTAMAEEAGASREKDVIFPAEGNKRFQDNPAMAWLEKHLFRNQPKAYSGSQEQISIHQCRNPLEEMQFAAEEIRRLVIEEGYRYRDIAVVTGELAKYGSYAERVFEQYQIPYFSDYKRNALANPAIACIRSLLECAVRDFTYESVGKLWRTGLIPIEQSVLDQMQNYILAKGIRGRKRWKEEWQSPLRGMEEEELKELNQSREQFIQPMLAFTKVIRSKRTTVLEKTKELYQLLEIYKVQEQLEQYTQIFQERGETALGKEYSQMYKVVIEILERLAELLGNEKMDGEEYAKLLDAGFAETKVGIIPPGVDQVTVGDIERSRLKDIRALFFLGVNDGVIPKNKSEAGILSELEREHLREQGIELAPGREEQYYTQKFYLYLNMTKPREKLYLSYSKVDASGEARNPSYLIKTVLQLFPQTIVTDEEERRKEFASIVSPVNAMQYVITYLRRTKPEAFYPLYRWFEEKPWYKEHLQKLKKAARDGKGSDRIQAALAKALYTNELSGSVTRLEKYAACAYAHFLQYGLGAGEREEYGFQNLDFGNILHEALELYAKELAKRNLLWSEVEEELQEQLIEQCVDAAILKYDSAVLYYTARDQYRITRMKRIAKRTVWALTKQLAQGQFIPSRYELQFHNTEPIQNGLKEAARLNLRGRIDRMDICEKEDHLYVKVMDYKTGKKEFKLLNVYYGTQLQLIVYLQAAMQFEKELYPEKKVLPAGIVYYRVDDPLIERSREADYEDQLLKALRVDGVISDNEEVLSGMDRTFEEEGAVYESKVIPVSRKKDGTLSARSKTVSEEEFQVMMEYASQKMRSMGEEILSGDIQINPYMDHELTSCSYCGYRSICMQERNGQPQEFRKLEKLNDSEIYARMKESIEEKHGSNPQKEES
ncbi:MAG: helicase-exonuclease AddAB subunit AddB [Lachnospiraceae bacterium]|nr:helicase-exonuclease AddAB subunit AddB [Lachnospiraceae bacterium]